MSKTAITTGTLVNERTVELDNAINLPPMKVRLAIEPLAVMPRQCYRPEVITEIHAAQAARGHRPPSRQEVDHRLQLERDSWGE